MLDLPKSVLRLNSFRWPMLCLVFKHSPCLDFKIAALSSFLALFLMLKLSTSSPFSYSKFLGFFCCFLYDFAFEMPLSSCHPLCLIDVALYLLECFLLKRKISGNIIIYPHFNWFYDTPTVPVLLTGILTGTSEGNLATLLYIRKNGEQFVVVLRLDIDLSHLAAQGLEWIYFSVIKLW